MLAGYGVEIMGESGSVETTIQYCFFIEIVPMFFRIRPYGTVLIPIFTLMKYVLSTRNGRVALDPATHVYQTDYGICIDLGDNVASPRGCERSPQVEAAARRSI